MNELKMIENDLVPVYETDEGIKVVNGRELHQALQSKQDFSTWVKRRLGECDAAKSKDFDLLHNSVEQASGTKHRIDYIIKLDTAKEMAMLERNEKGKQVRKYFIAVEEKYRQGIVDRSQLSPQMQMLMGMVETQARQELEQKRQAEQINRIERKQNLITETFQKPSDKEDFKTWVKRCIARIVKSDNFAFGVGEKDKYALAWNESYERLNDERPCRLKQRVKTAQGEALQNGATSSKVREINQLTIIAADKDLKPIYEKVIKEMMVYYCAS